MPVDVTEPPLNELLTIIKDDHWKHVRNLITPTFSGGKLRKVGMKEKQTVEHLL